MLRFSRSGDRVVLTAKGRPADVVSDLVRQLGGLVEARTGAGDRSGTPTDPALARLLPDPVDADADAAAELRAMIEPSLINHKLANAALVQASLDHPGALDASQELAWLKTLTDLRLVLAARLDIVRDGDPGRSATEPDRWMQSAYAWLGGLQADLLDVIADRDARGAA